MATFKSMKNAFTTSKNFDRQLSNPFKQFIRSGGDMPKDSPYIHFPENQGKRNEFKLKSEMTTKTKENTILKKQYQSKFKLKTIVSQLRKKTCIQIQLITQGTGYILIQTRMTLEFINGMNKPVQQHFIQVNHLQFQKT
jgi:hypothetical protein